MMKSAPPASAHLAEIPVPAPAPTRGRPDATTCRSFATYCSLLKATDFSPKARRQYTHSATIHAPLGCTFTGPSRSATSVSPNPLDIRGSSSFLLLRTYGFSICRFAVRNGVRFGTRKSRGGGEFLPLSVGETLRNL